MTSSAQANTTTPGFAGLTVRLAYGQNASIRALSKQSPMVPIDGTSLELWTRWVNSQEVNWADSIGRRNTNVNRPDFIGE